MTDATQRATQRRTVLFVSLTGDEQIKCYDLDPQTGGLTLRTVSNAHGPSGALCLHPNGKVLYDGHVLSTTLASFRLDAATGELTLINKVDTGIETPAHLITDRQGRFLLTAYYTGGGITVHRLAADGAIGELVQYINTGEKAHAVLAVSNAHLLDEVREVEDKFVFVPHVCPVNKTSQFRFDAATGQLTANDPAELLPPDDNTGPRHACLGPKGDVVYIVNEQGNTVTAHRFDAARGTLTIFQHLSTLPADYTEGGHIAHTEIHPNGQWLYASNRGHDSIAGFTIADDGSLTPFGHYPVPASPRSFNIDPTGHYLYCAGEAANRMTAYRIDQATGALQPMADYEVGQSPFWVMVVTL
jgi:6-phosphogluconolactonase